MPRQDPKCPLVERQVERRVEREVDRAVVVCSWLPLQRESCEGQREGELAVRAPPTERFQQLLLLRLLKRLGQ